MATIFHITSADAWKESQAKGSYRPAAFNDEGFIHCSMSSQVIQVANLRFRGQTGLVLLSIDTARVHPKILFENLEGGEQLFPHIYGELNIDAVVNVSQFVPGADGSFTLP
ncbi:MAG: DUF952 domain-containing protein [Acidobacteriota bacterium]